MALTEEGLVEVPGVSSNWVRLENGARAHYSAAGEHGPAVILLHGGFPGSSGLAGWRFMLEFLGGRGFRVYAVDRPGFGLADTREEYWPKRGWLSWAEFVEDFANALCLDEFFLAGNSNGAQNSAYYLVNHPERVKRVIFIATGGFTGALQINANRDRNREGRRAGGESFDGTEESMRALVDSIVYRKEAISDDLLKMRMHSALMQQESYAAGGAFNQRARTDPNLAQMLNLKGRLDVMSTPALYLQGKQDSMGSMESANLQEDALPDVQFFYIDECGHQGQTDQPEMFGQIFLEFFRDGRVTRKTAEWAGVSQRRPVIPTLVEA